MENKQARKINNDDGMERSKVKQLRETVIIGSHLEFPMTVRYESRQEEHKYGGQISRIRSEHRFQPLLDPGEPTRSLK
jgi:hypothetical protein